MKSFYLNRLLQVGGLRFSNLILDLGSVVKINGSMVLGVKFENYSSTMYSSE